jgi:hypothetical protein
VRFPYKARRAGTHYAKFVFFSIPLGLRVM